IRPDPLFYVGKVEETVQHGWARRTPPGTGGPMPRIQNLVLPIQYAPQAVPSREHSNCSPAEPLAALRHHAGTIAQSRTGAGRSRHMLQVDLLHHSILGSRPPRSKGRPPRPSHLTASKTSTPPHHEQKY